MNPSTTLTAQVTATFMKTDGTTAQWTGSIEPTKRATIDLNNEVPNASVSTKIESTNSVPIVAERAMYWTARGVPRAGCHDAVGSTVTATTWYLPEGTVGGTNNFDTWLTIQNPNAIDANVSITFMKEDETTATCTTTVSATQRASVLANDYVNPGSSFSTEVVSTNSVGIVVERPMYWDAN